MTPTTAPPFTAELLACSEAIALREQAEIDLNWTKGTDGVGDDIFPSMVLEAIKHNVEQLTEGGFTVRRAHSIAGPIAQPGQHLWLVRCPIDTPEGLITYPTEVMDLVLITPSPNGYRFGFEKLTREHIDQKIAAEALLRERYDARHARMQARDEQVADQRATLIAGIEAHKRSLPDGEVPVTIMGTSWHNRLDTRSANDLLGIAVDLGVDIGMLYQRGLEERRTPSA